MSYGGGANLRFHCACNCLLKCIVPEELIENAINLCDNSGICAGVCAFVLL